MGKLGFFDADKRLAAITAKGDPLEIEEAVLTSAKEKKSSAGRKPIATAPN